MTAQMTYCPRGGQNGLMVTKDDLRALAKKLGKEYIDEFVPVPNRQADCGEDKHSDIKEWLYWETPEGSHGWACNKCGAVMQWG